MILSKIKNGTCGIYCIINLVSEKRYIGRSKNIKNRLFEHRSGLRGGKSKHKKMQKDWNKQGEESFDYCILEECGEEELFEKEKYWIKFYSSNKIKFGYNRSSGGAGAGNYKKTILQRRALSKIKKGVPFSEEHKKNMSKSFSNKTRKRNKTKSSYIGINFRSRKKQFWTVRINVNGKRINVGDSDFEAEAAMMYNEAAIEYFGWKAKLNYIPDEEIKNLWNEKNKKRSPINNKLSEDSVIEIKKILAKGDLNGKQIAKMYSVSDGTIYSIKNHKTWTYLDDFIQGDTL